MSTLDRLEFLEKKVNEIAQLFLLAKDRIVALDHSTLAQAKTLAAIAKVLGTQTPNFSNEVMEEIRSTEDAEDRVRVNNMVAAGVLKKSEVVGTYSTVALKQSKDGKILLGYYTFSVNTDKQSEEVSNQLQGLKTGDTFTAQGFDFEVLEVFEAVTPSAN